MSDKMEHLKSVKDESLVRIVLRATSIYTKVAVMLSVNYADYEYYTVLELAQELARRFPITEHEEPLS